MRDDEFIFSDPFGLLTSMYEGKRAHVSLLFYERRSLTDLSGRCKWVFAPGTDAAAMAEKYCHVPTMPKAELQLGAKAWSFPVAAIRADGCIVLCQDWITVTAEFLRVINDACPDPVREPEVYVALMNKTELID